MRDLEMYSRVSKIVNTSHVYRWRVIGYWGTMVYALRETLMTYTGCNCRIVAIGDHGTVTDMGENWPSEMNARDIAVYTPGNGFWPAPSR